MKSYAVAALAAFLVLALVATVAQLTIVVMAAFTGMATVGEPWLTLRANAWWALAWAGAFLLVAWGARHWGGAHAFGQWPVVAVAVAGAAVAWWRLRGGSGAGFLWVAVEAVLVLIGYVVFERVLLAVERRRS